MAQLVGRSAVKGIEAADQEKLDKTMIELDGTENKAKLGANAILSVSLSVTRAEAKSEKKPLYEYLTKFNPDFDGTYIMPIPEMNVMNGGKHANWATDIQEYMLFPINAPSVVEAIRMNAEVYANLKKILKSKGYAIAIGDEGGFAPAVKSNEEPFQLMSEAIMDAGYTLGTDVCFGIDPAASEFFKEGKYILNKEGKTITSDELADFFRNLASKYPIISMEDIFAEDDWEGFKQIGTITETVETILLARKNGMTAIVSHRSGETEDAFIADFVVAMGTGQIKTGAPARGERTAKYNRLMRIERELGGSAQLAKFPFKNMS
ncbi:MAG: Enolase [Candidatus Roizmanbacteria bacterium GW2011_GWA2_34_18]|uniref:Enolase n=1 Tax=Candidatus Roizmanbacteria bacterium GW2011_GWA2_34_18 TaxID=1618477 RepID=A0A0G0AU27_9BACT|nr:MAG: Enolase [Candidatus Roizmanbacteria bacterium GW2011_GWA2_34_18]